MEPPNENVRGQGYGFHQIKNSYAQKVSVAHKHGKVDARNAYLKEQAPNLAGHVTKMKSVCAEILFKHGDIVPRSSVGVSTPNPTSVKNNVNAKIFQPTRGGTSVQFLNEGTDNAKINNFCKLTQKMLGNLFGKTSEEEYKANPDSFPATTIIPIQNVHMTAIAMGIVDAKDEESFNKQLDNNKAYRAVHHFFEENKDIDKIVVELPGGPQNLNKDEILKLVASHPDPIKFIKEQIPVEASQILANMQFESDETSSKLESFMEGGGAVFNAVDLKITDNGSIVIQLAPNNDLIHLKEALVEVGGIAKGGLGNTTAITVGYLPNFDKTTENERASLKQSLSSLNSVMLLNNFTVKVDSLNFVAFKVNSLLPTHIEKTPISAQIQLGQLNFKYLP